MDTDSPRAAGAPHGNPVPEGVDGHTILVTGGATGIGAEIVTDLVSAGARVVAADIIAPASDLAATAYRHVDVTDDDDLQSLVDFSLREFGTIDALVNCAALYRALGTKKALDELSTTDWDDVLRVNVRGTWQAMAAVIPAMKQRGGHIVNISSTTARSGSVGFPHYVASKAAVEGLTRAAARELGIHGITVNAVAPGLVDDDATNELNDREYVTQAAERRAIKRAMHPSDVASVVRFLCSADSGFITGQVLIVDGGGVFG